MKSGFIKRIGICFIFLLFEMHATKAQNNIPFCEVVHTLDQYGNPICFWIKAVCTSANDSCCGPRCVIDGNICMADCIYELPIDSTNGAVFHVEYINGNWRWGHVCNPVTNRCEICDCNVRSNMWAYANYLNGLQGLIDLAQYIFHNCCAPPVPNPLVCDSLIVEGPDLCTQFKKWCCNGKLVRLEFSLFDCNNSSSVILKDGFSVHLRHADAPKFNPESYDIFSDPDNPCALSEEQRRIILEVFLQNEYPDPCVNRHRK